MASNQSLPLKVVYIFVLVVLSYFSAKLVLYREVEKTRLTSRYVYAKKTSAITKN
jgi:CHASE3 domain sensor protein